MKDEERNILSSTLIVIEDLKASNSKLQTANDQLQAGNEELRVYTKKPMRSTH
jgi:hypothetical protein